MKKTLRIMGLCALAALTIASCKKNEQKADITTFQATLTQPTGEGRTHIGDGNWLMWDNNDAVKVFTANGTSATFTTHDANTTTATFNGNIAEADAYCAFYPAAKASGLTNGKVVLTLANVQQYAEGGFANGTYPMAAYTTGTTFDFHSPCGLLAIPMQGTGTITSIELTGKLNEPLAGQLLIDPDGFDPENQTFTLGDFQTTVTLNCGNGVALEENNAKTFYFVVPKNVFMQGFTAVVKNGGTEIYRLETTNNNIIMAENIRLMPTVNVASLGVTTNAATEVGYTTATLNGAYTAPAGMNVTEVGFYWGDATAMSNKVTATFGNPFTYNLTGLEEGHIYACQAYAKNGESELLGNVVEFTTDVQIIITAPTVTTAEVTEITTNSAIVGGQITDAGNGTISESGICYKTGNEEWTCIALTATNNAFSTTLTGLTSNTTYTMRAYATNEESTGYGEEVTFTTLEEIVVTVPTVTTNAVTDITANSALVGGAITNDGNGTVTESGICYKTGSEEWACVAIAATSNAFSMTLTGLTANTTYTVRAYATNEEGTGYGEEVSFTTLDNTPVGPQGIINGAFTINANGDQVYFSQGNLQYQASTNTWQFAEHQYDFVGDANSNISSTYSGWIDLFGWGTSGYNHGAVCYQPWSTSTSSSAYYAYGQYGYNLYDQTGQADWGYNAIANGGNTENSGWRTLTQPEWNYVFNTRSTASGIRYAKAMVNGVNGVILLPDSWTVSTYTLNSTNSSSANFTTNTITAEDWADVLETNGAVFLPSSGDRYGASLLNTVGSEGDYWSSSCDGRANYSAHWVMITNRGLTTAITDPYPGHGFSVRLVRSVQ